MNVCQTFVIPQIGKTNSCKPYLWLVSADEISAIEKNANRFSEGWKALI